MKLGTEIEALKAELEKVGTDLSASVAEIEQKIAVANDQVTLALNAKASQDLRKRSENELQILSNRQTELGGIIDSLDRSLYLCELFVKAKASLLTSKINERFALTTFRLFRDQINGGLQEVCDVLWRENEALPSKDRKSVV